MAKLLGWDQDVTTVYARFTVPKGTRASQVRVDAAVNSLLVFVLPADSTLSYVYEGQKEGGELSKTIISADVLWTLEEDEKGRRVVHVVLPKSTTGQLDKPWRTLFAEHEEGEGDEDEEPAPVVDDKAEAIDGIQPKRSDEQLCKSCFLLVRANAPSCPVGDDDCPVF